MTERLEFFKAVTERQRVFNDFVRAVGEHKLKAAQAELNLAMAAGEYARIQILRAVLTQLERDYRKLQGEETRLRKRIARMEKQSHDAMQLLRGRQLSSAGYSASQRAYKHFEGQAMLEADESLFEIEFPPSEVRGSHFLNNRDSDRPCEAPPHAGPSMNVLELMDWALRKRYIARTGSRAQRHFVRLFRAIASVPENEVQKMNEHLKAMKTGYYETWEPSKILMIGVNPTPTQIRILETTGARATA